MLQVALAERIRCRIANPTRMVELHQATLMKTIYVKGIGKFKKKLKKGLDKSELIEGTDYIEGNHNEEFGLIWCRDDLSLRDLKLAISAKYIWKYRMRFYSTIEEMNPLKHDDGKLTVTEQQFIDRVKKHMVESLN